MEKQKFLTILTSDRGYSCRTVRTSIASELQKPGRENNTIFKRFVGWRYYATDITDNVASDETALEFSQRRAIYSQVCRSGVNYQVPKVLYTELLEKCGKLEQELGNLKTQLNEARRDAAVFEFLLISRKELEVIAKYAKGCPDVGKFTAAMQKLPEFANIDAARLSGGKHFRNLLWMLATLDPYVSKQVEVLRNFLQHDPGKYIWFANQGQNLYDFFSSDIHDEGHLLNVKYVDKKLIPLYVKFLPIDLREAMLLFWNTME